MGEAFCRCPAHLLHQVDGCGALEPVCDATHCCSALQLPSRLPAFAAARLRSWKLTWSCYLCPLCRGTDLPSDPEPFECPLDFLLPIPALDSTNISYRVPGFLQLPQARIACAYEHAKNVQHTSATACRYHLQRWR